MNIYATSDTHFGHEKLCSLEMNPRPLGFSDMLLKNLTNMRGDILIHVGDFCIGNDTLWHYKWNHVTAGFKKKILVLGNHDGKSNSWYYAHDWDFVCKEAVFSINRKKILFTHEPFYVRNDVDFNVHGHLHGAGLASHRYEGGPYDPTFHKDMAPDINGWAPVLLNSLIK